ncbi:MAG: thiol-disulfide isomerase, partial [Bryobacteraceae bacterium]
MCALPLLFLPGLALAAGLTPTYNKDVLPVLQARCQGCHRPGEAAPFSMLAYKDTRPWAKAMKEAVLSRRMPPWSADRSVGHFKNDASLSAREIETLAGWVDGGAPEGDPKDAPKPLEFVEGWNIGKPDAVFEMPTPFEVPAQGTVDYQWVVIPVGYKEDKWLSGVECRPGDRAVVHHIIAFYRKPGSKWLA